MTTQPEALRLADALDAGENFYAESSLWFDSKLADAAGEAATELRRLHALNQELLEALKWMVQNDDTIEGDRPVDILGGQSWNQYNAYWIDGLNKARTTIAKAEEK